LDSLKKIKKYVEKNHKSYEDPIPSKSKERVLTDMAKSIRQSHFHSKHPGKGNCHLCGGYSEFLPPVVMKVCPNCARRFVRKGGNLKVVNVTPESFHCDNCYGFSLTAYTINARVCKKCANKIRKFHTYKLPKLRKKRVLIPRQVA